MRRSYDFVVWSLTKSAIAEHAWLESHPINWDGTRILQRASYTMELVMKEAMCIQSTPTDSRFNRDSGYELPDCWIALNRKLKGGALVGAPHASAGRTLTDRRFCTTVNHTETTELWLPAQAHYRQTMYIEGVDWASLHYPTVLYRRTKSAKLNFEFCSIINFLHAHKKLSELLHRALNVTYLIFFYLVCNFFVSVQSLDESSFNKKQNHFDVTRSKCCQTKPIVWVTLLN